MPGRKGIPHPFIPKETSFTQRRLSGSGQPRSQGRSWLRSWGPSESPRMCRDTAQALAPTHAAGKPWGPTSSAGREGPHWAGVVSHALLGLHERAEVCCSSRRGGPALIGREDGGGLHERASASRLASMMQGYVRAAHILGADAAKELQNRLTPRAGCCILQGDGRSRRGCWHGARLSKSQLLSKSSK